MEFSASRGFNAAAVRDVEMFAAELLLFVGTRRRERLDGSRDASLNPNESIKSEMFWCSSSFQVDALVVRLISFALFVCCLII
jgi:hypothetical protein